MRTLTKLTLALAIVAMVASAQPAMAACGFASVVTTITADGRSEIINPGSFTNPSAYYGYLSTLDGPPITSNVAGLFWRAGSGNTGGGLGDDSGGFDFISAGDLYYATYDYYGSIFFYPAELFTDWTDPSVDGCIFPGQVPTGFDCQCLLLSDQVGGTGYFALLGAQADATGNVNLTIPGNDAAGSAGAEITMAEIPAPSIVASRRVANLNVEFDVSVPMMTGGVFVKDGCPCGPTGFKVLQQILPRGMAPDMNRDLGAFQEAPMPGGGAQPVTALGNQVTIESNCGGSDTDVYLTTQLFTDSGFSTSVVSGNTVRIECGPNLADPQPIKPRPGGTVTRPGGKPSPRGRR